MKNSNSFNKFISDWKIGTGKFVNNNLIKNISNFLENPMYRNHLFQNNDIFNKLLFKQINVTFSKKKISNDLLRNRMMNELFEEIVPVILESDDKNSMMYSIENRSPYLDKNLIEYLYKIPSKFLIRNGLTKWFLRELGENLVPNEVRLDKRKRGFNASINSLINLKEPKVRRWILSDSPIYEIVDKKQINNLLKSDFTDNVFSKFIFSFISSKIFLENY